MGEADEEPERSDRRGFGARVIVPLTVAGAAVVVLSTALEGGARVTPFATGTPKPEQPSAAVAPSAAAAQPTVSPLDVTVNAVVQSALIVLACVIAVGVAVLLIRLLVSAIRARTRRTGPRRLHADGMGAGPEVADAPTVLRGIAAALAVLEEHREPGDAVVQAWLGLQQAAEDAGFARSAAETPTEFTGRVLSRTGADRVALRRLLRLYLRARFGDGAITATDATDARDALRALEASWQRTGTSAQPAARG